MQRADPEAEDYAEHRTDEVSASDEAAGSYSTRSWSRRRTANGRVPQGWEPVWRTVWPGVVLAVLVVVVWGHPVLGDFNTSKLANPGDSSSFEFYLGWNVHALLHAEDPFFTPNMYAPAGLDLGNAISVPAVSLLLAPITLLIGTTAAYNTGFLLAIWFTAFSTYLLARELGATRAGAVAAGALMALNPYFLGHALSHFNLMWIFGLPLIAYLFLRHLHGRLRGWLLAVGTALLVGYTFGASTELAVTQTVFGAIALVVALLLATADTRVRLLRSTAWLTAGGAVGGVLALPVVLAALQAGVPEAPANPPALYSTDLFNVLAPTNIYLLGGETAQPWTTDWLGNGAENTAYIPFTLVALVVVVAVMRPTRLVLGLALFAIVSLVLSFGPALVVDGMPQFWMPWAVTAHVPGLDHALPARFSTFVYLALSLVVAVAWPTVRARAAVAAGLVAATLVLTLPDFDAMLMPTTIADREFVRSGAYRDVIERDEIVLVLPAGQAGPGLQWVTDSDFFFRVPTGNGGGAKAPADLATPVGYALFFSDEEFGYGSELGRWARNRDVSSVLVPDHEEFWNDVATEVFGPAEESVDGVQVYRVEKRKGRRSSR